MRLRVFVPPAVMIVAMLLPSATRSESYQQIRQGWLVGLSLGGGSAQSRGGVPVTFHGTGYRREGLAGSLRLGYAFKPELSLELNSNAWTNLTGPELVLSVATAALNYYPGASGLVLRGGVGVGTIETATENGRSTRLSGLGLTAGAAYEFRRTRRWAIGPQVDFTWTEQGDFSTYHITGGLGLTWYFIAR